MKWRLPKWLKRQPANVMLSIGDPATAAYFGIGFPNYSGVEVTETTALTLSAVWRAVSLIAGTIATLPLRTLRDTGDGMRQRIGSLFDDPGALVGLTPFNWTETVVAYVLLHGDCFLQHIYGGAGQLLGLKPIHPLCVTVEWAPELPGGKRFIAYVMGTNGMLTRREFDASTMTQIMGLSLDGLRGISVIAAARNSLGTAVAGDRGAARMFSNGALISGMVSADEDVDENEAKIIKETIDRNASGYEHAGGIPFFNRKLKFTPWTMSAADAQFLESRQFSVREVARWFGIPPHLLMETSAASNWGTGIEQQNLGLARFNLVGWTCRIEQALSRLLPRPRFVEYDFAGLERPNPEDEIRLLIEQVQAGLLTLDEARAIRNLPPLNAGPSPAEQASQPEGAPANA